LFVAGRLIKKLGPAPVVVLGLAFFSAGCVWWALGVQLVPDLLAALGGIVLTGIGVGLTMPTLMGAAAASLPQSSFATGSGVVNMIRQTGMAIGVAALVALVGTASTPTEKLAAFRLAWWLMAAVIALGLVPLPVHSTEVIVGHFARSIAITRGCARNAGNSLRSRRSNKFTWRGCLPRGSATGRLVA
jgi:MFS family permease